MSGTPQNQKINELVYPLVEALMASIIEDKEKIKDMSLVDKIDKLNKLVLALKERGPAIQMTVPIAWDPKKANSAQRIVEVKGEEIQRKLLK
jgi:hypothetical protein